MIKENIKQIDTALDALNVLESVRVLIAKYPGLANHSPNVELPREYGPGRLVWWPWNGARDLITQYPEFGWTEVQPDIESEAIDAVATVDGIEFRIIRFRLLNQTKAEYEPFIPRDLTPEHKEFVEEKE